LKTTRTEEAGVLMKTPTRIAAVAALAATFLAAGGGGGRSPNASGPTFPARPSLEATASVRAPAAQAAEFASDLRPASVIWSLGR
jgi:hypothetical protein